LAFHASAEAALYEQLLAFQFNFVLSSLGEAEDDRNSAFVTWYYRKGTKTLTDCNRDETELYSC